jgi:hypothetical protein
MNVLWIVLVIVLGAILVIKLERYLMWKITKRRMRELDLREKGTMLASQIKAFLEASSGPQNNISIEPTHERFFNRTGQRFWISDRIVIRFIFHGSHEDLAILQRDFFLYVSKKFLDVYRGEYVRLEPVIHES